MLCLAHLAFTFSCFFQLLSISVTITQNTHDVFPKHKTTIITLTTESNSFVFFVNNMGVDPWVDRPGDMSSLLFEV